MKVKNKINKINNLKKGIAKYIFIPAMLIIVSCTSSVRFASKNDAKPKQEPEKHKYIPNVYASTEMNEIVPPDSVEIDKCIDKQRHKLLKEAETWLGTPYLYGGETRDSIDCSAFVMNVFRKVNVNLPRTAAEQNLVGRATNLNYAQPGDLVFFNDSTGFVSHVGIYAGNGIMIHASATVGVTYQKIAGFGSNPIYCGCKNILGSH